MARLVEDGAMEMVVEEMAALSEEAVIIVEAVVKRGGLVVVAATYLAIKKIGGCVEGCFREG